MCRGGYWLNEAPRLMAYGVSSGSVTPDRTKPCKSCLDVSSVKRVTPKDREVVKPPTPRHSIAVRYPSAWAGRDGADDSSGSPGGTGEPGDRRDATVLRPGQAGARATSRPPAPAVTSNSSTLQPGRASRAVTLISRTGVVQRSSQVNLTRIMSLRGWQAPHGLAGQPATLSTGIRGSAVCTPGNSVRASGKAVTEDRPIALLAPVCSPSCSPDGPFRRYSLRPEPGSTGLSCENFRAGSQDPEACAADAARGLRLFTRS